MKKSLLFVLTLFFCQSIFAQAQPNTPLYNFLTAIPGAEVTVLEAKNCNEFYKVMLPQMLNHNNMNSPKFMQRLFIRHRNANNPTVIVTEGYGAEYAANPDASVGVADLFDGNSIVVEHRYFLASTPTAPLDWEYLTVEQAAADYHYIRQLFREFYQGKWVATGISKGGMTTLSYEVFYPDDTDASVAHVAPVNFKKTDPRIGKFFDTVGDAPCREKIRNFQQIMLERKRDILPIFEQKYRQDGGDFNTVADAETMYDYTVLEYEFSFWQWSGHCEAIPSETVGNDSLFNYLNSVIPALGWFDEKSIRFFAPSYYQFYSQLGYYEYDYEIPRFKKWLKNEKYPSFVIAEKTVAAPTFTKSYLRKMKKFLRKKVDRMIFVYGEYDPWGATAVELNRKGDALKFVVNDGTHRARITDLAPEQKKIAYAALEKWLGTPVAEKPKEKKK
ncbi:MAG: hypothetical protein KA974_06630 [Saprospiraceae bacterium]|nr:hypothetical protein [Saprospiraceae bacterium]MBP7699565.1 hypothetical protein [Saprospiraceae bacterium]